jgi:uncharacterized protein
MSHFTIKQPKISVENISIQPQPIEGVSTSTTAFLGETQTGPTTPTLITSWLQFQTVFGGYFGEGKYLPYAVEGFFLNGGNRCYVCRVLGLDYASALDKLKAVQEISILYSPNAQAVSCLADTLIEHGERFGWFVIFDSLKGQDTSSLSKPHESSFAAMYYPWIYVKQTGIEQKCLVPPGGHIAGIYARVDAEVGVHKVAANQVVKGVVDLEYALNRGQLDILNPEGVNCIRTFKGRGILVWGARTLSGNPESKYINVSRLLIYLEQSIKKGTEWVAFEFNNETTWAKVRMVTENFLMYSWKNGLLMGASQKEAYFFKCDRTTMTQSDIDNGRLNMLIGVAVMKPAEFLIFRVNQATARS